MKWFQKAHSFLAFHYTLISYMFLFITVFKEQQKVAASFSTDNGNKTSTNTFMLNVLVDYGSFTTKAIGIHAIIAFRMNKLFGKLINSLDQTENFLLKKRTRQENQQFYAQYRTLSSTGIVYILSAVKLYLFTTKMPEYSRFSVLNLFYNFIFYR